ncbi:PREDICTED: ubiquitin-like-specific protease ESD4 [Nelumbo nucifera]|uniref:Ubiquitin-like-specific protease ESD4 n=1 Tax=Nelumbo nucifera TaxID=4432 RepID=A0A1U8QBY4_NELNU|nr:PREDICTED: ubiquitin-like-specific protease ESD4 [Nelumbo nucifera]
MKDGEWVSSAVVNCIVDVLVLEQFTNDDLVKRYYFPSYFAEKILKDEPPSLDELNAFYDPSLLRYDLWQYDMLFIPLCILHHWFLYVINLRDKKMQILNSLPEFIIQIEPKHHFRMKETCSQILSHLSGTPMPITEWGVEFTYLPIQKNKSDCGIFMIKYMEYWDGQLTKSFSQDDIPYFRRKITADLLLHSENKIKYLQF